MISIVIPAMNEANNVSLLFERITQTLKNKSIEVIFVNDGSTDNTLNEIKELAKKSNIVKYISFSRNFGHQSALMAGIRMSTGQAVVTMDCDLQHPPELIPNLISEWKKGFDIVYTVRSGDNTGFVKRVTSSTFYYFINMLSNVKIDSGAADYRLIDRKVLDRLLEMNESVLFLRGIISWMGFRSTSIKYVPDKRKYGETKYSINRMICFAIDGITSMSVTPLRISSFLGLFLLILSCLSGLHLFVFGNTLAKDVLNLWIIGIGMLFLSGIQLLMMGILGEYVGKNYLESKRRPQYLVSETNIT